MSRLLAWFRKVPDSPSTKLEAVNKEISQIENSRRHNQFLQKKIVASLVIYSILIYLVAAILFFVYYFPVLKLVHKIIYSLPLLLFPAVVYCIKRFLHWYFVKRITTNDLKLSDLKEQKNKIIEDVMENETYKKATEILEKYAPNRLNKLEHMSKDPASPPADGRMLPTPGTELRQRTVNAPVNGTPVMSSPAVAPSTAQKITMQQRSLYGAPPGPPLPRQVLPRERSYVDKMFEYLVGDGPQNRYALICKYCHSHNGMALPEEFEYLGFRCCYCFCMNDARKQRLNAPRLNLDTTVSSDGEDNVLQTSDDSESEDGEAEVTNAELAAQQLTSDQ